MRVPLHLSRRTFLRTGARLAALAAAPLRRGWLYGAPPASVPACVLTSQTIYPPPLAQFIAKLDPSSDSFPTEEYAAEIDRILDKWSATLTSSIRNHDAILSDLAPSLSGSVLHNPTVVPLRSAKPLRIERRTFAAQDNSVRNFLREWKLYLDSFATIRVAEFEIFGIRTISSAPLQIETEIRSDLVGTQKDGATEQRVGAWTIRWERDYTRRWTAQRWQFHPEVRSVLTGPGFTDITAYCLPADAPGTKQLREGIDHFRTALDGASGIDVYGNHGIAVGDIDGSGFDSFYVCQPSGLPNRLYRNRGDGTFEDITEASRTGILDGTASAIFADFTNSGRQSLLVVRTEGPLLFVNQGDGHFELHPYAFHFERPPQGTFTSAAVADYDRDGFLDIYLCAYSYYQGLNQYQFPAPYYDAQNGPPNFLFRNRRDGSFEDITARSGMDVNNNRFSFAAAWCDYDNNGWPDLYVANDFGRKNLYRNNGDGTFTDIAHAAGVEDYGPGMSVCWSDYDNDGLQDLYVANMWLPEGKRITENQSFLPDAEPNVRALYQKHNAGNSLYRNSGDGAFHNRTEPAGSAMGRWSWSCAAWDFDHSGTSSLYVANGFVSGPRKLDLQSFFWRQVAQRSLAPAGNSSAYEMAWNAVNELVRSDYSWSGYQRNVFYANDGGATFSDVSGALRLDFRDDSRAYALTDLDGDGRCEILLKNRTAPQLRVLRNDLELTGNCIVFRLNGTTSNRDAIGAVVTVKTPADSQTKFISAGSGFASQHTKELFFGVGQTSTPVSAMVRWPSGVTDHFDNIPVNRRVSLEEEKKEFTAKPFQSPSSHHSAPAPLPTANPPGTLRTWLIAPVFGPNIQLRAANGKEDDLNSLRHGATILTFFSSSCAASQQQLLSLQQAAPALASAGLSLLLVSAGPDPIASDSGRQYFTVDEKAAGAWNVFYRYLFDRRRDLQFPASFLLNNDGAVIVVYQGFVDAESMIADWRSAPTTPDERLARALPFAGPYHGNPMKHNYFTDGVAFVEYGYVDHAQEAFTRVVESDPSHSGGWFNLGTILLGKKNYDEARRCLQEAARLNPNDADAWNNLGMISGEQGRLDQALTEFQNAARANPNHVLAVQNMVRIFQYQSRPADAQRALEELVLKAPQNAGLHLGLGMALVGQNLLDRGREELETATRLDPNNPDALNDLGAVLLLQGRSEEALARFDRCRLLAPDFDRAFLNSAKVYRRQGENEKAKRLLTEFLTRHPDDADVQDALKKLP